MERNDSHKLFKISMIIVSCLFFLYILKISGLFNFLYFKSLNRIANKDFDVFNNFIDNKVKITETISSDVIVQSALIQYENRSLMDSFKHLNLYKRNFSDSKSITMFNSLYEIVLTSEVEEYIINQNLSKEWFLNALAGGYYISEITYDYNYNEYIICIIKSINNIIDENIGFIMIDFSLSELFDNFKKFKNTIIVLKKQKKFIFTYPLKYKIDSTEKLKQFPYTVEKELKNGYKFIVAADSSFFSLPDFLRIILILLFIILVFYLSSYSLKWYSQRLEIRNKTFKNMTGDIVALSKSITIKNIKDIKKQDQVKKVDKTFIKQRKESKQIGKQGNINTDGEDDFHLT